MNNTNLKLKNKVVSKKKKNGILKCKKYNKVSKSFKKFKKYGKSERIYVDEKPNKHQNCKKLNNENNEEFTENKVFRSSYFYKTHMQWNNLPLNIRMIENCDKFKNELKEYLWEELLLSGNIFNDSNNRSINSISDHSFELPGD